MSLYKYIPPFNLSEIWREAQNYYWERCKRQYVDILLRP